MKFIWGLDYFLEVILYSEMQMLLWLQLVLLKVYSFFSSAANLGKLQPFFVPCCQFSKMLATLFRRHFEISGILSYILGLSDIFYCHF